MGKNTAVFVDTDNGRIRACEDLLISVHRSWQTDDDKNQPPTATTKAMAPLARAITQTTTVGQATTDHYLAAVAAHDAVWIGFETDGKDPYIVFPSYNGVNLLSGLTTVNSANDFLLIPDQPWIDYVNHSEGKFHQIIPDYKKQELGGLLALTIHQISSEYLIPLDTNQTEFPLPLDTAETDTAAEAINPYNTTAPHPWQRRMLLKKYPATTPCHEITIALTEPDDFENLTGTSIQDPTFNKNLEAPANHELF